MARLSTARMNRSTQTRSVLCLPHHQEALDGFAILAGARHGAKIAESRHRSAIPLLTWQTAAGVRVWQLPTGLIAQFLLPQQPAWGQLGVACAAPRAAAALAHQLARFLSTQPMIAFGTKRNRYITDHTSLVKKLSYPKTCIT